jgi:hypothetical protein
MQASGSTITSTLPPNPPPTVPPTTCRSANGRSMISAVLSRVKKAACVLLWMRSRPSPCGTTMQPVVSVGACSIGAEPYVQEKTWSAAANPASTSPNRTRRQWWPS